jgi:ribosomal protein S18 acetylase RimI-like enzyme
VKVKEAVPLDRARIRTILELTGSFSSVEVECALSLFDAYVKVGPQPDEYIFCCAYDPTETVLGFICYGKASLTDRVYDLYWIATDPRYQGRGVGRLLIEILDGRLKKMGARMVLAETSSRFEYRKACQFYMRSGFEKVSTIQDYYALGEDLIVFAKRYL